MVESPSHVKPVELVDVEALRNYSAPMFVFPGYSESYPIITDSGQAVDGTLELFEVAATKNYQLVHYILNVLNTGNVRAYGDLSVYNDDDSLKYRLARLFTLNSYPVVSPVVFFTPFPLLAGEKLKIISSDANTTCVCTCGYYEIDT